MAFDALDTLLRVMCIPGPLRLQIIQICRTSDGVYLFRCEGEIGYDHFLGKPYPVHPGPGLEWTTQIWNNLTSDQQKEVRQTAANPDGPILLSEFGIQNDDSIIQF